MIRRSVLLTLFLLGGLVVAQKVKADDPPPPPPPPLNLTTFISYFDNGVTVYEGDVVNFSPGQTVTLTFGILFSATINVNADGSFIYEKLHPPGTNSVTSATAKQGSITSNTCYTNIFVP